ncbi:MAG: DUF4384 domain-containing protein [Arenicella sp.]
MNALIKLFSLSLCSVLLSGCLSSSVIKDVEKNASHLRAGPKQLPHKNITDFSDSLHCMDDLFISFGVGRGDYAMLVEELKDKTTKVNAGTRQMMISAISEMTKRSGALRLVTYGADAGNLISFINESGKKGTYDSIPAFDIIGSISQFDDSIYRKQSDISSEIAGTNNGSSLGLGGGTSASSSVTFMTLDLGIITSHDLSIMPGVHTKNTVELYNKGSSTSFDAGISKTGVSYSFSANSKDATGQALRGLIELSTIELIGRLTKLPYWNCLGMDGTHPTIQQEISDWYFQLAQMQILHRTLKLQLATRGYYSGNIDEEISEEYLISVLEYKKRLGLPPIPAVDLNFYRAFLNETPVSVDPSMLAYTKKGQKWLDERDQLAKDAKNKKQRKKIEQSNPPTEPIKLGLASVSEKSVFNVGDEVFVTISSNTNGYLNCYFQREDAYVRVFPNRFSADGYISANGNIQLPDSNAYSFIADNAVEKIHCFLAAKNIDQDLPALLKVNDLEQLPIESIDIIENAYKTITNDRFGQSHFTIRTE